MHQTIAFLLHQFIRLLFVVLLSTLAIFIFRKMFSLKTEFITALFFSIIIYFIRLIIDFFPLSELVFILALVALFFIQSFIMKKMFSLKKLIPLYLISFFYFIVFHGLHLVFRWLYGLVV